MSIELRIPIDNEAVLAFWKARAHKHGHSIEEEIRQELNKAASGSRAEERFAALREKIQTEYGVMPDSTPLIRSERDA